MTIQKYAHEFAERTRTNMIERIAKYQTMIKKENNDNCRDYYVKCFAWQLGHIGMSDEEISLELSKLGVKA